MRTKLLTAVALAISPILWASGVGAAQITFGPSDPEYQLHRRRRQFRNGDKPHSDRFGLRHDECPCRHLHPQRAVLHGRPAERGHFHGRGQYRVRSTYTNPDGDTLTETWQVTFIQDNTPQPKFFGTGITTAISGDAAFLAAFGPVGTIDRFDFIEMPITCAVPANCTTLDQLATTTTSASAPISSGEKLLVVATPEPASLGILGSALVGLTWFNRRRRKAA